MSGIKLYSAGTSSSYRLGRNTPNNSNKTPTAIDIDLTEVVCIAAGWQHNVIVYANGSVVGWGSNTDGQIGLTERSNENHPTVVSNLADVKVIWASCGDKITAYLTDTGFVYVANKRAPKNRPYKLNIPSSCVYCACGINCVFAITREGTLYQSREDPTEDPFQYKFPKPIYDVAGGENFIIAVTVDHVAYGHGKVVGNSKTFIPIHSLKDVRVLRVFGYNQHCAVTTVEGRVYTFGTGGNGRLGHGNEESLDTFKQVAALKSCVIVDIDMGDSHTVFVDSDGGVWACGASDDGRLMLGESHSFTTPERSKFIPGHAVFATCGCFHTYVLTGDTAIVHPGMKIFLIGQSVLQSSNVFAGNEEVNVDAHCLLQLGLFPGDIVRLSSSINVRKTEDIASTTSSSSLSTIAAETTGTVFGLVGTAKIAVVVKGSLKIIPIGEAQFVSRRGFVGVHLKYLGEHLIADGGRILRSYGLVCNEVLLEKSRNVRCRVLGTIGGGLYLRPLASASVLQTKSAISALNKEACGPQQQQQQQQQQQLQQQTKPVFQKESEVCELLEDESNLDAVLVEGTLQEIFESYQLVETKRDVVNVLIDGIVYPCERVVPPFFMHRREPVQIFAKFAFYYVGSNAEGACSFFREESVSAIETNGTFYAFDTVIFNNWRAMITAVGKEECILATEDPKERGAPILAPVSEMKLIARAIPDDARREIEGGLNLRICPLFGERKDHTENEKGEQKKDLDQSANQQQKTTNSQNAQNIQNTNNEQQNNSNNTNQNVDNEHNVSNEQSSNNEQNTNNGQNANNEQQNNSNSNNNNNENQNSNSQFENSQIGQNNASNAPNDINALPKADTKATEIKAKEEAEKKIDSSEKSSASSNVCPCDLFVGQKGFATVLGYTLSTFNEDTNQNHNNNVKKSAQFYAAYNSDGNEAPFVFDSRDFRLVRRTYEVGDATVIFNEDSVPVILSALTASMAGTGGLLQGDEVLVDGETMAVVCGARDHYLWLKSYEEDMICINTLDADFESRLSFVDRPTKNYRLLL